jgi:glycosyltransferase involved in cell wall biosynthesis
MIRTANLTLSLSRNAGGLFESVRRLVQSLVELGMEVNVFGLQDEFTGEDIAAWRPAPVRAFKPTWPRPFGYSPCFLEELLAFRPDLTHSHGIWVYPGIAEELYARSRNTPYVISAHGMLDSWAMRNSRWKKRIAYYLYEEKHLKSARCLRALCEPEARAIRDLRLHNDIAIIPNGVDLPGPAPAGPAPWDGWIEPGRKVLLFLGRIHPKKGLLNLVRAWAALQGADGNKRQPGEWVLAIAGWDQGGHELQLRKTAADLGLSVADLRARRPGATPSPSILFLGPQFYEARDRCYRSCDGFVLPSLSEGVPMAVLEAWVHAKPVIMTPQCNLDEGFTRGAALKVNTDPDSLLQGLNELIAMTPQDRAGMGQHGHALACEKFVWPKIALQMNELYQWMLGGGGRPACLANF